MQVRGRGCSEVLDLPGPRRQGEDLRTMFCERNSKVQSPRKLPWLCQNGAPFLEGDKIGVLPRLPP